MAQLSTTTYAAVITLGLSVKAERKERVKKREKGGINAEEERRERGMRLMRTLEKS
jgi:hypothetical protein